MAIEESKVGVDYFDQIASRLHKPRPSSRLDYHGVAKGRVQRDALLLPVKRGRIIDSPIQPSRMIPRRPAMCRAIPHDFHPSNI